MIRHIRKLAVINDTTTDEVALLSNVTEGVDGATTFGLGDDDEFSDLVIEDQQTINNTITRNMNIRTLVGSSGEETNIEGYVDDFTDVYIVGLGLDGAVIIGDKQTTTGAIKLVKNEQRSTNRVWELMASVQTQPGFDPSTGLYESGFWVGKNLLGGYAWGDADSGGIADGWSASGFDTTSFSSGEQTLEADTTQRDFERAIYFPFEGVDIVFSINNDSRSGTYATEQIEIEFIDTSGSVISSETTTFSSTGRKNVTATTPGSDLAQVLCRVSLQADSGTVTNEISDPALRIDGQTTYTKY